jgi:hypothetical protein
VGCINSVAVAVLLMGMGRYIGCRNWWVTFIFAVIEFLVKETYAVLSVFLVLVWLNIKLKKEFRIEIIPLLTIFVAFVITFTIGKFTGPVFVDGEGHPGSPYEIVLKQNYVVSQWFKYSSTRVNGLGLSVIILTACGIG